MLPQLFMKALLCALLIFSVGASAKNKPAAKTAGKKSAASSIAKKKQPLRKAGSQWFLSHAEFSALTRSEQKKYLKDVKKVLAGLPEKSSSFAKTSGKGRTIASETKLLSDGVGRFVKQAELWRGNPPPLYEYTDETKQGEFRQKWENSMWWLVTARVSYAKIPDSDSGKAAVGKRIEELEDFYLSARKVSETSFDQNGELNDVYARLNQAKKGEVTFDTPGLIPSGALVDVLTDQKIEWKGKPAAEKPAEKEPRIVDISGQKTTPPAENVPSLRGYRCMYAGFVIKNDPCRGPQELPEGMSFKGIDSAKLSCDDGQILCNPLLFGLKTDCKLGNETPETEALTCLQSGSPLCVARGKFATRECGTQSASEGHLASAAALIRANPEAWSDYLTSFYELCDDKMIVLNEFAQIRNGEPREVPESTLADIEQTCTNAKKQLTQITADYRIETGRPAGSKNPEEAPPTPSDDTEVQQ